MPSVSLAAQLLPAHHVARLTLLGASAELVQLHQSDLIAIAKRHGTAVVKEYSHHLKSLHCVVLVVPIECISSKECPQAAMSAMHPKFSELLGSCCETSMGDLVAK